MLNANESYLHTYLSGTLETQFLSLIAAKTLLVWGRVSSHNISIQNEGFKVQISPHKILKQIRITSESRCSKHHSAGEFAWKQRIFSNAEIWQSLRILYWNHHCRIHQSEERQCFINIIASRTVTTIHENHFHHFVIKTQSELWKMF